MENPIKKWKERLYENAFQGAPSSSRRYRLIGVEKIQSPRNPEEKIMVACFECEDFRHFAKMPEEYNNCSDEYIKFMNEKLSAPKRAYNAYIYFEGTWKITNMSETLKEAQGRPNIIQAEQLEKGKKYLVCKVRAEKLKKDPNVIKMVAEIEWNGMYSCIYMPTAYNYPTEEDIKFINERIQYGKPPSVCYYGTLYHPFALVLLDQDEEVDTHFRDFCNSWGGHKVAVGQVNQQLMDTV